MATSDKLSAKTIREIFPAEIADCVLGMSREYKTRYIYLKLAPAFYIDEDANFVSWVGDEFRAVSASGEYNGVGHNRVMCNRDVNIPVGGYVIKRVYYSGKYFLTIYHNNGQAQIR